jgi:predicted dehydrogenase
MTDRLRVGVIGCGLIAQLQHLPNLRSRPDLFEVVAVADRDVQRARNCAERFTVGTVHDDGEGLLGEEMDAVVICTSWDHANLVSAAAGKGIGVLVEKPLCLDLATAVELQGRLGARQDRVMLGYMRRYDEAFTALESMTKTWGPGALLRTRTAETAASAYLRPLPIDEDLKADEDPLRLASDDYSLLEERLGGSSLQARLYKNIILDSLVHEVNMVQALVGRAKSVPFAELSDSGASVVMRCERGTVQLAWVTTPGAARYVQEIQVLGANGSAAVRFDSPYLPVTAGVLTAEGGGPRLADSWQKTAGPDVEGAFKRELVSFHSLVVGAQTARTSLAEAVSDIAACEAIGRAAVRGQEVTVEDVPIGSPKERSSHEQ